MVVEFSVKLFKGLIIKDRHFKTTCIILVYNSGKYSSQVTFYSLKLLQYLRDQQILLVLTIRCHGIVSQSQIDQVHIKAFQLSQ